AQAARRVAMREVDAELVHPRAEIARQLRHGAVAGVWAGRHTPPEAAHRRPVIGPHRQDPLRHLLAGELPDEVEMREVALDDMGVAVDDRVVELGADIAPRESFDGHGRLLPWSWSLAAILNRFGLGTPMASSRAPAWSL